MNKVVLFIISIFLIISLTACTDTNKITSVSEWDLRVIGYYKNWDKDLYDQGYSIGIIDISSKATSDDGLTEVAHTDLLKSLVERLSTICMVEVIELSEDNISTVDLIRAIENMIDSGIRVINISLGTSEPFEFSDELNEKIISKEVFIVCSAGNTSIGLMYPALCENTYSILPCDIYKKTNKNLDDVQKRSYTMPGLHINLLNSYFSGSSLSAVYFSVICSAYCSAHPNLDYQTIVSNLQNSCIASNDKSYGIIQINSLF